MLRFVLSIRYIFVRNFVSCLWCFLFLFAAIILVAFSPVACFCGLLLARDLYASFLWGTSFIWRPAILIYIFLAEMWLSTRAAFYFLLKEKYDIPSVDVKELSVTNLQTFFTLDMHEDSYPFSELYGCVSLLFYLPRFQLSN